MTNLSNILVQLREKRGLTQRTVAERSDISIRVMTRVESRHVPSLKLSTLEDWAKKGIGVTPDEWQELLVAWVVSSLEGYKDLVRVEPKSAGAARLRDKESKAARIMMLVAELSPADQDELLKVLSRPESVKALAHLNRLASAVQKK